MQTVRLPKGSPIRRLITEWAARQADAAAIDDLVIALGVAVVQYANALAEERWLAQREGEILDRQKAQIEELEGRLHAVREATWGPPQPATSRTTDDES